MTQKKHDSEIRILIALSTSRYSQSLVTSAFVEIENQKKINPEATILVDVIYVIEVEELKIFQKEWEQKHFWEQVFNRIF